jgi:similar to spore coat protein
MNFIDFTNIPAIKYNLPIIKTLCLAKSKLMQELVFDHDLRALMQKDVEQSMQALGELKAIYQHAPLEASVPQNRPTPIIN